MSATNTECPWCGSPAYQGLLEVECTQRSCRAFREPPREDPPTWRMEIRNKGVTKPEAGWTHDRDAFRVQARSERVMPSRIVVKLERETEVRFDWNEEGKREIERQRLCNRLDGFADIALKYAISIEDFLAAFRWRVS